MAYDQKRRARYGDFVIPPRFGIFNRNVVVFLKTTNQII